MNLKFTHPVSKPSRVTYDSLAALARQGLGKSGLSPAEAAEVRAAVERHRQRQLARKQGPRDPLTDPERQLWRLHKILQGEQGPIYRILRRHYRIPHSRRIDTARTHLIMAFGTPSPSVRTYTDEVWHHKKHWKATRLWLFLTVSTSWWVDVYRAGLAEVGGLLTLSAKQVAQDAWAASWLVQGRGYDFRVQSGYIVRAADGTYAHARSLERARAIADGRTKVWGEKLRQAHARRRAEAQARLRELCDQLAGMTRSQIIDEFGDVPISIKDSVRAGNCLDGTRKWCNEWTDGHTSGTIQDALESGAPLDECLLRALAVAIARWLASA